MEATSVSLETSISRDFQATRDNAHDPGQAIDHFKQWKSGVGKLHDVIDKQLKFCQELRNNHTLLSLYEDTESETQRKFVNTLATQMKVDIRSVIKHYPAAKAITLPTLDVEELEERLQRETYEHKMQESNQKISEGKRSGHSNTLTNEQQAENDEDDRDGDGLKRKVTIEHSQRELHARRVNLLLKSIELPDEGEQHLPLESMLSLMTVRSQLVASIVEAALFEKRELYESFGVDLDLETLRQSEAGEGREMHALHDLLDSFRSVLETVSACMLMQSYGPVDSIRRLQAERDDLKASLTSSRSDLELVRGDLIAEKNSRRNMNGGQTVGAASLQVQLRAETRRCKILERDLQIQWELHAKKDSRIQALHEKNLETETKMNEQSKTFQEKTKWFGPHVEHLESSVESTGRSYQKLETDVQLLSIMYKDALRHLDTSKRQVRNVEAERDLMSSKLQELIKKLQMSRQEERRKDAIARKTMMARRTALEATAAAKEEQSLIASKEKSARGTIATLQQRLNESQSCCQEYSRQKNVLEERLSKHTMTSLEKERIIEKLTQEKIQMSKMHSTELKELVMRPAQEEVDVQLAELRGQLEEAKMTNEALKEALATSQLGS